MAEQTAPPIPSAPTPCAYTRSVAHRLADQLSFSVWGDFGASGSARFSYSISRLYAQYVPRRPQAPIYPALTAGIDSTSLKQPCLQVYMHQLQPPISKQQREIGIDAAPVYIISKDAAKMSKLHHLAFKGCVRRPSKQH